MTCCSTEIISWVIVASVEQGQGDQEQQLRSELSLEKAQVRRQHERELKALQDKMADEQVNTLSLLEGSTGHRQLVHHVACL